MQRQHTTIVVRRAGLIAFLTLLCIGTVVMDYPYDAGAAALLFVSNLVAAYRASRERKDALKRVAEGVQKSMNDELGAIIRARVDCRPGAEHSHTD